MEPTWASEALAFDVPFRRLLPLCRRQRLPFLHRWRQSDRLGARSFTINRRPPSYLPGPPHPTALGDTISTRFKMRHQASPIVRPDSIPDTRQRNRDANSRTPNLHHFSPFSRPPPLRRCAVVHNLVRIQKGIMVYHHAVQPDGVFGVSTKLQCAPRGVHFQSKRHGQAGQLLYGFPNRAGALRRKQTRSGPDTATSAIELFATITTSTGSCTTVFRTMPSPGHCKPRKKSATLIRHEGGLRACHSLRPVTDCHAFT
jgi:hypothetical protein